MAAPTVTNDAQLLEGLRQVSCTDFSEFQEALRRARTVDDRITNALNTSIPTDSFKGKIDASEKCKNLYDQLSESYRERDKAIKRCIGVQSLIVKELREKRENDRDNANLSVQLRKQQTTLRLIQSEINVEEVVKDRTFKIFYERCRHAYKPPDIQL